MNKIFPFYIGADPEFSITFDDKQVSAEKLVITLFRKTHKYDKEKMGFDIKDAGSIGWDGVTSTGEVRPNPNKNPAEVVNNIKKLFEIFIAKSKIFTLSANSNMAPLGGHVHFEIEEKLKKSAIIDNIHKKFVSFYLPVQLGEDIVNVKTRTSSNYGKFTDYRTEKRNNNEAKERFTYEFRVPTAEWLANPRVAIATLAYLATIWNEIVYRPRNFAKAKEMLFHTQKQSLALQELANTQYGIITKLMLGKIRKYVKTFEYYQDYKDEIDFILSPDKVLAEKKKTNYNILEGWKINETKEPTKKALLSERKIKQEMNKVNMEDLLNLVTILYNPDINVEHFAQAIKTRIITLNWKLKNKYLLFGLRKGVPGYIIRNPKLEYALGKELIKTRLDAQEIDRSFSIMRDKFMNQYNWKPNTETKKSYLVGIPYTDRINLATKGLINVIHELENGKAEPATIATSLLLDDRNLSAKDANKLGKIFQIYTEQKINSVIEPPENSRESREIAREIREEINNNEQNARHGEQLTEETLSPHHRITDPNHINLRTTT